MSSRIRVRSTRIRNTERPRHTSSAPEQLEHGGFFLKGDEAVGDDADSAGLELPTDPTLLLLMRPEVRARRAKFTKLVRWTVGLLLAFCVVAVGKGVALRAAESPATAVAAAATSQVETVAVAPPPEVLSSPPETSPPTDLPRADAGASGRVPRWIAPRVPLRALRDRGLGDISAPDTW